MSKTLQQAVEFTNTNAQQLYEILMNSEKHSTLLGMPARISRKTGGTFSLFDGNVSGKNLLLIPNRLIVQSWRGSIWKENDVDSLLILSFSDTTAGGRIDLLHTLLPDHFEERWQTLYWTPLLTYLQTASQ